MDDRRLWKVEEKGRRIAYEGKTVRTITVGTLYNFLEDLMDYTGYIVAEVARNPDYMHISMVASSINQWAMELLDELDELNLPDGMPLCELENDPSGSKFVKRVIEAAEDIGMTTSDLLPGAPIWTSDVKSLFGAINTITSCYHALIEAYLARKTGSRVIIYSDASPVAREVAEAWDVMVNRNEKMKIYAIEDALALFGVAYGNIFRARVGNAKGHAATVYCKGNVVEYFDRDADVVLTVYLLLRDSVGCSIRSYDGDRTIFDIDTVDERVGEVISLATSMDYRLDRWKINAWCMLKSGNIPKHAHWTTPLGDDTPRKILKSYMSEVSPTSRSIVAAMPVEVVSDLTKFVTYGVLRKISSGVKMPREIKIDYEAMLHEVAIRLFGHYDRTAEKEIVEATIEFLKAVTSAEANACWKYLSLYGVSDFWRREY